MTPSEGRKFGGTLAAGFGALALLAFWRHRVQTSEILAAVSLFALLASLFAPTRLRPVERAWMGLGHAISRVTSPIFFTVLYLVVLTPAGILRRNFGKSPLARSRAQTSFWVRRDEVSDEQRRESLEHLY